MEQDAAQTRRSLTGRRVLLTGGTTGIGRAALVALAREGARVLTFGRHEAQLAEALAAASLPREAGLIADAAKPEDIARVFNAVDERLGGLDVLINNAAVGPGPIAEEGEQEWRYAVEANLVGYMACAREALGRLEQGEGGQMVFISSIAAETLCAGESVYAATKGGVNAFALTLRKEVADQGIRVTVIEPGSVGTDMQECTAEQQRAAIDQLEMLFSEDLAETIVWTLTRPERADVVMLRIEPARQKLG